ncbi:uncharacterized protein M421DRAFT_110700 [Didymella exigua CBS 183.55]|uniref:Uncharacterized protein n=1 Tax=Didymella exigua CBS 183.55 TaxID=1150837 RepID=A0A6A5S021_9PLEO|nr:uncharacterized protein M421DRAFT_110700 [Didymella exigua CBS 183.55]KAF1934021.1 hypothetical protein M421DRAFT_110700 [Didymella exigua CBS 183.55]
MEPVLRARYLLNGQLQFGVFAGGLTCVFMCDEICRTKAVLYMAHNIREQRRRGQLLQGAKYDKPFCLSMLWKETTLQFSD